MQKWKRVWNQSLWCFPAAGDRPPLLLQTQRCCDARRYRKLLACQCDDRTIRVETNPVMLLTKDDDRLRTEQRQSDEKGYLHGLSLSPGATVSPAQLDAQAKDQAITGVEDRPLTVSAQLKR